MGLCDGGGGGCVRRRRALAAVVSAHGCTRTRASTRKLRAAYTYAPRARFDDVPAERDASGTLDRTATTQGRQPEY